jgi:hypothetical protein
MWLYYWLAAHGIDPIKDVKTSWCRRRRWWPTCVSATWTVTAWASRGGSAPSRQHRLYCRHHPGHLDRSPGKGAGAPRPLRPAVPQHRPRHDLMAILERPASGSTPPPTVRSGRSDCRQEPTSIPMWRSSAAASSANYDNGLGKSWSDEELHEVLQRRPGELPVPVRRHVVPDPAQALGPAQAGPGLPGGRQGINKTDCTSRPPACRRCRCPSPISARRS